MTEMMIQDDLRSVEDRIKLFEKNTGCELLLVVTKSSDPYPAASWRFGFISAFLISLVFSYYYEFHHVWLWPVSFFILTFGLSWVGHFPWAKRLALSDWEVKRECFEKAVEFFHTLGTSKTTHKVTAMIMVSILEKRIQVLVDEKLKAKIAQKDLDELIQVMQPHFRNGNMGLGLTQSIQNLEERVLSAFNGKVSDVPPSELKDTIHFF